MSQRTCSVSFSFFRIISTCFLLYLTAVHCQSDEGENSTPYCEYEDESEEREDALAQITEEVLEDVFKSSQEKVKNIYALEEKLAKEGRIGKTSYRKADLSHGRSKKTDPVVRERELSQLPLELASDELYDRYNLSATEIRRLSTVSLDSGLSQRSRDNCTETVEPAQCDRNARFRTADGQCNNLDNPTYGSALSCQQRLMNAYYIGISDYRESVRGGPLPAPRTLSLNLHYHVNRPADYVSHMYMFFGQLLNHDMALTPDSTTVDNEAIECCPPEQETHPQCRPILIGSNDPFYSQYGVTCLNFVRSAICATCTLGPREHGNAATSFIDASFVYGNSDNETVSLRMNDGTGRMRIQTSKYGDLLPSSPNPNEDQCSFPETNDICFESGDPRVNQHTVLASLHTIFIREHNRIANELGRINPQWSEERLFQEARRIVGAQMQVITYKEYLPITLGNDRMSYFELWMGSNTTSYNSQENPSLILEFSSAAFRFGHSLIYSTVADYPLNSTNQPRLLRDEFSQPFDLYRGIMGPLLRSACNSEAESFDQHLEEDVTNFLLRVRGNQTGLDLASININRGRDHGIPPYVEMVRYCSDGEINICSFSDLVNYNIMADEQAEALRKNYRDVNDVDLWPGILMEIPIENAVVGPTGACIIGEQFRKLKYGDRFYFEHTNGGASFSSRQKEEISKTTLSKILCLNTDIPNIAQNAMLFNSTDNPVIACSYVTGIDLSYWSE